MKASAIVYTSQTGFTKRYAQMLGEALSLPVHELTAATRDLPRGVSVVYLGWMMAGSVKGLKKAASRWSLSAVCPVGMGPNDGRQADGLREKGAVSPDMPVFYLRGGYAPRRVTGVYKPMMSVMGAIVRKGAARDARDGRADPAAVEMGRAFADGGDWVSAEQLAPVIDYIK